MSKWLSISWCDIIVFWIQLFIIKIQFLSQTFGYYNIISLKLSEGYQLTSIRKLMVKLKDKIVL